ncbi:TraB/GumN family protein [Aurantivibrio plasticivorans]
MTVQARLKHYFKHVFLLLILFSLSYNATSNTTQCADPSSSLLWRLPGEHSTVYIFGSIHLGSPSFYPLHPSIEKIIRQSDHFVFELAPDEMNDPASALMMQQQGMLPAGQRLDNQLSPTVLNQLRNALASYGLPADNFMVFKPWFLTVTLSSLQLLAEGYSPEHGVESYVMRNMPTTADTHGLETMESQITYLQTLDGEAILAHTLASLEQTKENTSRMMQAWQCADKATLLALTEDEFSSAGPLAQKMEDIKESLLYQRNHIMAEKIKTFIKKGKGNYFVVVGVAHLLGEQSIVHLLKQKGYQIRPVSLN